MGFEMKEGQSITRAPELLAPAGGPEALVSAVINGADAVYVGLSEFSARAKAANFSRENLSEWVEYAALYGVKVYLAVNTVIKEPELAAAVELVEFAWAAGVSAIIVQDRGLIKELRGKVPYAVLHGSTQMGVHNFEGAAAAKRMGLSRVIVARETLLSDIRRIKSELDIEVECFVQGALCVAFSGNCYYSSMVAGASGNRGRCLQFCRKHYASTGEGAAAAKVQEGSLLSAKDLCLLPVLESYRAAGVDSFKIEGRMRRNEYVGGAVSVYRAAIDNGGADRDSGGILKRLFNRGDYLGGYPESTSGERGNPVIFPLIQGHIGLKSGTVKSVDKRGVAVLTGSFNKGDGLKFVRGGKESGAAVMPASGNSTTFAGEVRAGDEVRITTDAALNQEIGARVRKIDADITVRVREDEPVTLTISSGTESFTVVSDWAAERAKSAAMLSAELSERVSKLNSTPFVARNIDVDTDNNCFVVVSKLNGLRSAAADGLKERIIRANLNRWGQEAALLSSHAAAAQEADTAGAVGGGDYGQIIAAVDNIGLLNALPNGCKTVIFCPRDYNARDYVSFCSAAAERGLEVLLNLPVMARGGDMAVLKTLTGLPECGGVVVNNIYGLDLVKGKRVIFGTGLNILNSRAYEGCRIVSVEGAAEINKGDYVCAYIHRPVLMTVAHCPNYTTGAADCSTCSTLAPYRYKDDHGLELELRRIRLKYCYREIRAVRPYINTSARGNIYIDLCGAESTEEEVVAALGSLGKGAPKGEFFAPRTVY